MKQLMCPLDGLPCEKDCPDRYNQPEGGCILTTLTELGGSILTIVPAASDTEKEFGKA